MKGRRHPRPERARAPRVRAKRARGDRKWKRPALDLTGKIFGRLTVLEYHGRADNGQPMWNCLCSCGRRHRVNGIALNRGNTKSCGCLRADLNKNRGKGKGGTPLHPLPTRAELYSSEEAARQRFWAERAEQRARQRPQDFELPPGWMA